jgi:D-amino-acid dehydrogenase
VKVVVVGGSIVGLGGALPIVGRLGPESNVLVASGHGMLGLTLAPSTAKTVRDLARDVASGRPSPLTPYGPERFLRSPRPRARS